MERPVVRATRVCGNLGISYLALGGGRVTLDVRKMECIMSDLSTATSIHPGNVKPRFWGAFILPVTLLILAVLCFVCSLVISPLYIGGSATTTGTILSSPNYHPVVSYTVDGTEYTVKTMTNMPSWQLGQEITITYNPRNPAQASTTGARTSSVVFGFVALACAAGVVATGIPALRKRNGTVWAIAHGHRIEARITGVTQTTIHFAPMRYLTRLTCEWTSPDGLTHTFRTLGRTLPYMYRFEDVPITTLPVYIDPENPEARYYVDDSVLSAVPPTCLPDRCGC